MSFIQKEEKGRRFSLLFLFIGVYARCSWEVFFTYPLLSRGIITNFTRKLETLTK
jgi:hypothetical protein